MTSDTRKPVKYITETRNRKTNLRPGKGKHSLTCGTLGQLAANSRPSRASGKCSGFGGLGEILEATPAQASEAGTRGPGEAAVQAPLLLLFITN